MTVRKFLARGLLALAFLLAAATVLMVAFTWAPDRPVAELTGRWAPPPSTFIDVKGLKVHVRDEGPRSDPAPIVLIHGTSASLHTWEGWVAALKGQRRVITMDLPGFGLIGPNAHRFQQDIAGSELMIFDDLGHVPHEEDPARTVKAVQAFLKR
jgi:pimeloyl-ACP methyl ester carboxylesterase